MEIKADKREGNYPTKFTPETVKAIVDDISQYVPYKIAAEAHGVAGDTFKNWLAQGIFDLKSDIESKYAELATSIKNIESKRIKECLSDIRVNEKGHRGAEWTLERCFWKYFSANSSVLEFDERLSKIENNSIAQGGVSSDKTNCENSEQNSN